MDQKNCRTRRSTEDSATILEHPDSKRNRGKRRSRRAPRFFASRRLSKPVQCGARRQSFASESLLDRRNERKKSNRQQRSSQRHRTSRSGNQSLLVDSGLL